MEASNFALTGQQQPLQGILEDAKNLVLGLRQRDRTIDTMLSSTQALHETVRAIKEYQSDVHDLNNCHRKPRSGLIHSLQQENRQIRCLKEENRELRTAVGDHEVVMGLLMEQHRAQDGKLRLLRKLHRATEIGYGTASDVQEKKETPDEFVVEFAAAFSGCLENGEENASRDSDELKQLETENETIRSILASYAQMITSEEESPTVSDPKESTPTKSSSSLPDSEPEPSLVEIPENSGTIKKLPISVSVDKVPESVPPTSKVPASIMTEEPKSFLSKVPASKMTEPKSHTSKALASKMTEERISPASKPAPPVKLPATPSAAKTPVAKGKTTTGKSVELPKTSPAKKTADTKPSPLKNVLKAKVPAPVKLKGKSVEEKKPTADVGVKKSSSFIGGKTAKTQPSK